MSTKNSGIHSQAPLPGNGSRAKLLLVDDDAAIRRILLRLLADEGYEVESVPNGELALETISQNAFDLILLDLNMPEMDGWETFEQLAEKHPLLPVMVITARPNQMASARAAGVGALLEKPLDCRRLLDEIARLLAEPRQARLARLAGRPSSFTFVPPEHNEESN